MTAQFSVDLCERLESLSSLAGKLAEEEQNSMEVSRAFAGWLRDSVCSPLPSLLSGAQ